MYMQLTKLMQIKVCELEPATGVRPFSFTHLLSLTQFHTQADVRV